VEEVQVDTTPLLTLVVQEALEDLEHLQGQLLAVIPHHPEVPLLR
tara:strand:+ start:191 stop:325 length:135 start_codon:yes stop_codon:yes gene_type:complete